MTAGVFDHPLLGAVFGHDALAALFGVEAELAAMIRVEVVLARAQARLGTIPAEAAEGIAAGLAKFAPDMAALRAGTAASGVAVPALVPMLRAAVGEPHGGFVHYGATTQDIVDTALVLRLRDALTVIGADLDALIASLANEAERYAALPLAARTRSQVATPTTLGLRIAGWLAPLLRCRERLAEMRPRLLTVQMGGASGTIAAFGVDALATVEGVAAELELGVPLKPWHAERDGMAELAGWLSLVTGALGKMGGDLILTGRSESGEVRAGQGGGSSTMPQKSNPVAAEALVSLARFNAGQVGAVHQAMLHAEERDCAAWALEWMALPQMVVATGAALGHARRLAGSLAPDPQRMAAMLGEDTLAEAAAFAMAEHMPRSEAQGIVKRAARAGGPLLDALEAATDTPVDWTRLRDVSTQTGSAADLVARVVNRARESIPSP